MTEEGNHHEDSSQHISLLSKESLLSSRLTITDKAFNSDNIYQWKHYTTPKNFLCFILLIVLIPTFLTDTLILNQINSLAHLSIIFVLLFVISLSLITNNILYTALENIPLDAKEGRPFYLFMCIILITVSVSTIYYDYSGVSILLQVLFRFELSILILDLVYLQYTTKEKTAILLKSFIIHRDTLEMIEEEHHLAKEYYDIDLKKQRIINKKPQLLFIQKILTSKLVLSCIVVLLLVILGIINLDFWKDKIKFMMFIYINFTTPIVFSTYQITHFNEKITMIESDLRIRTYFRVKLLWWTPRRELIFGTIVSLGVNAIRIFVPL